jgi:signal transduction histidine kinase/CheY-like chemotaxis protein/HPt (histidine-containing phosphotransfer) domain-containing protein
VSLRQRIILVLLGVFTSVAAAEMWVHTRHTMHAFERIELEHAEKDLRRCAEALDAELARMANYNYSWSAWDDSYKFVQDRNQAYVQSNLLDSAFEPTNIHLYYFYDRAGKLIWSKAYNADYSKLTRPGFLPEQLDPRNALSALTKPNDELSGLVESDGMIWLISAQPIVTSEQLGPAAGVLVMGRILDLKAIGALSKQTRIDFSITQITGPDDPDRNLTELEINLHDQSNLVGHQPIPGLFGQRFLINANIPRDITAQGRDVLANSLGRLGLLGLILAVALLMFFESAVVRRLEALRGYFSRVSATGALGERIAIGGRDEIGALAAEINRMFDELELRSAQLAGALATAKAADNAKTQFLAIVSHEIRTPLNGVLGMLSVLIDSGLSPEQLDYAQTARHSAEALLSLLNDVLDYSKLDAGKLETEQIGFDIRSVVEDAVRVMGVRAIEKRLDLNCSTSSAIPERLIGDPNRLRQVLMNLLSNAVKFTQGGEVFVSVEPQASSDGTILIRFEVRDTGIGIPEDSRNIIFDAFRQADASTTRRFGGTGLGLAICRQIVTLLGGEIGFDSQPGIGTTFWFTARFSTSAAEVKPRNAPRGILSGKKILIVDDNPTNRMVLDLQLGQKNISVCEADGSVTALRELEDAARGGDPYDIALLDFHMPEMDGAELAGRIRKIPALSSIRLVLISSFGQRGDAEMARSVGFDAYLTKPVSEQNLIACLEAVVGNSAQEATQPTSRNDLVTVHSIRESQPGLKLLVAEDNVINQKVALSLLKKMGLSADVAADGSEALEAVKARHYDAVLMDWHMPEMDGIECAAAIRRLEGPASLVPIIAVTASVSDEDRQRCIEAGMNDFVSKPLRPEELSAAIQRCCDVPEWGKDKPAAERPAEAGVTAKAAAAEELPPLDLAAGIERHGTREFWCELAGIFLEEVPKRIGALRAALAAGDLRGVGDEAHGLKGSSGEMVAQPLRQACMDLEQAARAGESGKLPGLLEALLVENERLRLFMEAELARVSVGA